MNQQMPCQRLNPEKIWDVLVEYGGAREDHREMFVTSFPSREFRFQGHFGFGGKVRVNDDRARADYYPEDRTPDRDEKLERLNIALAQCYST